MSKIKTPLWIKYPELSKQDILDLKKMKKVFGIEILRKMRNDKYLEGFYDCAKLIQSKKKDEYNIPTGDNSGMGKYC